MFVGFENNSSVINLIYLKQLVLISVANSCACHCPQQIIDSAGSVWQWQNLLFYQSIILIKAVKSVGFYTWQKLKYNKTVFSYLKVLTYLQLQNEIIILSFRNYYFKIID